MSEMTHWLNETKVRLENKKKKSSLQGAGWWGCRRQRMRRNQRRVVLLGAEGQSKGRSSDVSPGLPWICPRLGTWGLR